MNRMKINECFSLFMVILLVGILTVFLGTRKVNYLTDEVWNYGLANNLGSFYPDVEYGRTYTGMGFFEDFLEVGYGDRFSYFNVLENQASDVHPPLYYLILHTVCSFFYGTYSKWYAIGINLFWGILIEILLYKLIDEIVDNKIIAWGYVLIYGTTVAFMDTMLFLRMYAQFVFFTIALSYLLKHYWNRKLDRKFYILLSLMLVLGTLTHYYFLIIAFALMACFLINLCINKDFSATRKCIICSVISGLIYLVLWFQIIFHLFGGYRGQQAFSKALSFGGLIHGARSLFGVMNQEAFAGGIYCFLVIGIASIVLRLKEKKSIWRFETALLLSGTFYITVVGKVAPFLVSRYIMPVFFVFELAAYLSTIYLFKRIVRIRYDKPVVIVVFIIINVYNLASRNFYVPMDNYSDEYVETVSLAKNSEIVYFLSKDEPYGIYDAFGVLPEARNYVVYDIEDITTIMDNHSGDYIVGVYDIKGDVTSTLGEYRKLYNIGCATFFEVTSK